MNNYPGMREVSLADRGAFGTLFVLQHYFPKSDALKRRKGEVRQRIVEQVRAGGPGRVLPIDRRRGLTEEEFRREYLAPGIPVILEGAGSDWKCSREWSFDNFRRRFGSETIKLVERVGLADGEVVGEREFSEEIVFSEFLDGVLGGAPRYMRFSPLLEKFPELLDDVDDEFLRRMPGRSWGTTFQLFIGPTKAYTPLHNAITPFFFVNICGVKRWQFIPSRYMAVLDPSPDGLTYNHTDANLDLSNLDRYPGFDCVDRIEGAMGPGDILFNPSWMWHCVRNEAPTIGVRCGFVYPWGMLRESFTQTFVRAFAGNPSMLRTAWYSFVKTDLPEREDSLLTPRVFSRK